MWSYVGRLWASSKPVTRLEQFNESANFMPAIEKLRAKVEALGTESLKAGSSWLVKEKFTILHSLVTNLNQSIDKFNAAPKSNYLDDLQVVVALVIHLCYLVYGIVNGKAGDVLSLQQDGSIDARSLARADTAMHPAVMHAALLAHEVAAQSLTGYYVVNPVKRKLKQWYGVDPYKTASVILLEELRDGLVSAFVELNRKLQIQMSTIDLTTNDVKSPSTPR